MDLLNNDVKIDIEALLSQMNDLKLTANTSFEFEIRLGTWSQNVKFKEGMTKKKFPKTTREVFNPSLDKQTYDKIFNSSELYQRNGTKSERTIVWMASNINNQQLRMIKVLDNNNKTIATKYEIKEKIDQVNLQSLGMRISLNSETNIINNQQNKISQFNFIRFRDRISKISKDGKWRYDFTSIVEREFNNISEAGDLLKELLTSEEITYDKYEVEIESIVDNLSTNDVFAKINQIGPIFNDNIYYTLNKDIVYKKIYNLLYEFNIEIQVKSPKSLDFTRNLISKPVTLQMEDLSKLEINEYSVTDKADGTRHLMFIDDNGCIWLINNLNEIFDIKGKGLPNSLIDGEYIDELSLFAAFDCLVINGQDITQKELNIRLKALGEVIENTRIKGNSEVKLVMKKFLFNSKDTDIYKQSKKILKTKVPYKIDGLIFTPVNAPYRNNITFKWKLPEMITTDFLIRRHRTFVSSKDNKKLIEFYLFVGINRYQFKELNLKFPDNYSILFPDIDINTNFFPTLFMAPDAPEDIYKTTFTEKEVDKYDIQDNTIVELSYVLKDETYKWKFVKTREDKTAEYRKYRSTFGNAWKTAMSNLQAVLKPITEEIITGIVNPPFFTATTKQSNIKSMRKFHNFIKGYFYNKYTEKCPWLLEVSGGRFGDMNKWIRNGVKNVVVFDIDKEGIKEGLLRFKQFKEKNPKQKVPVVYTGVGDSTMDWGMIFKRINNVKINEKMFNVISIQFAINFITGTPENIDTFVKNISTYIKSGGIFMASALDGEAVIKLLNANKIQKGESLDLKKKISSKKTKTIISIKKECVCNSLEKTGQEISVFIESIGNFIREYLVNFDYLINVFQRAGFELVDLVNFEDMYQLWRKESKESALSDVEKIYSFMGRMLIMKKL